MKLRFVRINPLVMVGAILLANAIVWIIPSSVAELIAREQPILLGRYSRTHFAWILGLVIVSPSVLYLGLSSTAAVLRRRSFAVLAMVIALVPTLLVTNVVLYAFTDYPYAAGKKVYHRPPNARYDLPYDDVPEAGVAYPVVRPGFGHVECKMTFDANGYRNATVPDACDIVCVGDSFTEGSRVSDGTEWPAQLARATGLRVYNIGISGYGLPEYLAAIRFYGLPRKPKTVVCMLYEGNDFRSTATEAKAGVTLLQMIKASPLLMRLDATIIRTLGPIGSQAAAAKLPMLDWLPMALPAGATTQWYAFAPKNLLELFVPTDVFRGGSEWYTAKSILKEMRQACDQAGARLVIGYAPGKAHVVFPPVAASLPGEKVLEFCKLRMKKELPPADRICAELAAALDNHEMVITEWCSKEGIPFISLTKPLREASLAGRQCYYTYDQHWSPVGHEEAAKIIKTMMNEELRMKKDKS